MADSDEPDDHRLAGRTPRPSRLGPPPDIRPGGSTGLDEEPGAADADADDQIDAVTRLMGFLRSTD